MLGDTVLLAGDRAGAIALFERGLAAARQAGVEGYLLRCAAPLAAATGSRALLAEAAGLLEQASIPDGGAWMLGYEAYLSLARGMAGARRAGPGPRGTGAVAGRRGAGAVDPRPGRGAGGGRPRPGPAGRAEQARAALDRAARLAAEHGLPHVLRDVAAKPWAELR